MNVIGITALVLFYALLVLWLGHPSASYTYADQHLNSEEHWAILQATRPVV